ncbi:MAG: bifunctional diaminohydroxyphosphoribosylaminopyrimidine deaminase/5-amino-6-(5-phosphoribosylamino)uracil reductase RibD [Xanthomonadales bacterium]|nr:bifunctional diaminohydroxyphosphoribosylaminopyrimidine deaminase/5-amino-6-(5-phosphoribosylamino)uracil reductase RibD [Xanthomonadales bacterium]
MPGTDPDQRHLQRALQLAAHGLRTTQPNPRVGCVLVRDGVVVGEGWHQRRGGPHAEVYALREAGERARGATAYVTLEPCSHHGKTPPCCEALIAAGVTRVVAAMGDPFPAVDGRGFARLREAGIAVEVGLLAEQAEALNEGFLLRVRRNRPLIRLKLAMSLDGRTALADGRSMWITGPEARADVQQWRARACVVLTGIGSVLADDPRLAPRIDDVHTPPDKWVLDSQARLPARAALLGTAGRTVQCSLHEGAAPAGAERLILPGRDGRLDLDALMQALAARPANEVHVEAGATLAGALLDAGLVDELLVYVAPVLLGAEARPLAHLRTPDGLDAAGRWQLMESVRFGADLRLRLRPTH